MLRRAGLLVADTVTQHCGAGEITVTFSEDGTVELSAAPRDLLGPLDDALVAALLEDVGLSLSDVAGPVWVAGTGLSFVHLPVLDEAVPRARPSFRPLSEYADQLAELGTAADPVEGINLHHVSGQAPDLAVHARVFVPGLDVAEDPATGSAAGPLGAYLSEHGVAGMPGRVRIRQGAQVLRPSLLVADAERTDRGWVVHVEGGVRVVGGGWFDLEEGA